jgi:hypothetical protein
MASKKTWFLQNTEDTNLFGLGNMDIVYTSGRQLKTVEGSEKLQFLALKCVLTGRYTDIDGTYGSTISRLVGAKARGSNSFIDGLFAMAADRALENFRKAQPFGLDKSEKMTALDGEIQVARDRRDRTILLVGVSIRNAEGKTIPVIHSFKVAV